MMKLVKTSVFFCVLLVLILSCPGQAMPISTGTVDIVATGTGASDIITLWGGGQDGVDMYAGVYMLEKTGGTGEGKIWSNGPIGGICTDLSELAPETTLTYDVITLEDGPVPTSFLGGPMGAVKADYIRELWGRFYDPSWVGSGTFSSQQNELAGAFGAAVWEIVYEDLPACPHGWDVTVDGSVCERGFRSEYGDADTANSWLHTLDGTGPKADLRVFASNGGQDFIVQVPEPATVALLGLGGVLSLLRRKRSTK